MATLTGQSIASSYEQLLHTDTDGGGNGATLVPIKDGDNGTTFSLELATTSIAIGATHKLYLDGGGNTYITESSADIIQLVTGGTTRMVIDANSRISLGNNDSSGSATNTIFGYQTGNVVASGAVDNTLFGYQAGLALTTGDYNTAFGSNSLKVDDVGQGATAIGYQSLHSQNTASEGYSYNTGVGMNTSYYNVTGVKNTAVGADAMVGVSNNNHSDNTAVGFESLKAVTTGGSNVAIGSMAGKDSTTGHENVYIGQSAGENATTHADNVMIGFEAGKNLAQSKCVAIGHKAYLNGAGDSNLAIGYQAMGSGSVSGYSNQAIGRQAMDNLTGGDQNIAIGEQALQNVTTENENVSIGNASMANISGAEDNVSVGHSSLNDLTSGDRNIAIGHNAGHSGTNNLTAGVDNVLIGYNATANAVDAGNCIVIGSGVTGQDHNSVTLGNADVTKVYMAQDGDAVMYADGTINTSDKRLKENINDCDLGLSFINALNPISYQLKNNKESEKVKYGIIAQEVQEVLKESGNDDFAGITDKGDYLGADYVQFIAPLIKAIQELSAKVKELEEKK